MVDELMLRDVDNILKKLELIRSREDLKQILKDNGMDNTTSEEDINLFLVTMFMSEVEISLYKKYIIFKKREDLRSIGVAIDALGELTSTVANLYEEHSRCKGTTSAINGVIEKIDTGLRGYPNIRVSTAYNRVRVDYKRYFDAFIKDGMDRAVVTEEIDKINRSSVIVRRLKKRKLSQLREGLKEHNSNSKLHIDTLYGEYISSREEYGTYLREVMTNLLKNNKVLFEAGMLSLISMYKEDIPVKALATGVKVVDKSKVEHITPEYIASKAFEYFQKLDEPDFDEKMFIKAFRDFLLHFYSVELERLNREANGALRSIREAFNKQKNVTRMLSTYQDVIEMPDISLDTNTTDTFALVYQNNRTNK